MINFNVFFCIILIFQHFYISLGNGKTDVTTPPSTKIKIPLTYINHNYYGNIVVGTPKNAQDKQQTFRVNFDTGSQHLWLKSTDLCPPTGCKNVNFKPYDKNKSSSYKKINTQIPFSLQYADKTKVTGSLGWEKLQLGDGATVSINQVIGFANHVEGVVGDYDGIFGLGLISQSLFPGCPDPPDPPMWTLNKQYNIKEFGIYLSRVKNGKGTGQLVFGGHDESLVDGKLQWHDVQLVSNQQFMGYKIKIDKIILQKGSERKEYPTTNMLALPDSGNNVIAGPMGMFTEIKKEILKHANFIYSANKFTFFCKENVNVLPNLIFVMGGREYVLRPEEYTWEIENGICQPGLYGYESPHIVLGQIFMQTFYTKFNLIDQTVGFARAKHQP